MDDHSLANWFKVRHALEASGKTKSDIYRRSVEITNGKINPNPGPLGHRPTT